MTSPLTHPGGDWGQQNAVAIMACRIKQAADPGVEPQNGKLSRNRGEDSPRFPRLKADWNYEYLGGDIE
ncbi:MAG: hypothetical protein IPL01_21770 [Acidobacteria bacterium]|nr:hypothetical protein [Acidobacteriota bacterium]